MTIPFLSDKRTPEEKKLQKNAGVKLIYGVISFILLMQFLNNMSSVATSQDVETSQNQATRLEEKKNTIFNLPNGELSIEAEKAIQDTRSEKSCNDMPEETIAEIDAKIKCITNKNNN